MYRLPIRRILSPNLKVSKRYYAKKRKVTPKKQTIKSSDVPKPRSSELPSDTTSNMHASGSRFSYVMPEEFKSIPTEKVQMESGMEDEMYVDVGEGMEFYDGNPDDVYEALNEEEADTSYDEVLKDILPDEYANMQNVKEGDKDDELFDEIMDESRRINDYKRSEIRRLLGDPNYEVPTQKVKVHQEEIKSTMKQMEDFDRRIQFDHDAFSLPHNIKGMNLKSQWTIRGNKVDGEIESNGKEFTVKLNGYRFTSFNMIDWIVREKEVLMDETIRMKFDFEVLKVTQDLTPTRGGRDMKYEALGQFDFDATCPSVLMMKGVEGGQLDVMFRVQVVNKEKQTLKLSITYGGLVFESDGTTLSFNREMASLQNSLPENVYMKSCWNCKYAIPSPLFEQLETGSAYGCFLSNPEALNYLRSRRDLMGVWHKRRQDVHEFYVCESFDPRKNLRK